MKSYPLTLEMVERVTKVEHSLAVEIFHRLDWGETVQCADGTRLKANKAGNRFYVFAKKSE